MRKKMIENAAYEVATQCRVVEESIDATLEQIAELQGRILRANSVATTGFATAQQSMMRLAETTQALVSARGAMAGCHAALAEARDHVPGLRTVSFGDGTECPPRGGIQPDLRVVA
jgi:hypothetical protein